MIIRRRRKKKRRETENHTSLIRCLLCWFSFLLTLVQQHTTSHQNDHHNKPSWFSWFPTRKKGKHKREPDLISVFPHLDHQQPHTSLRNQTIIIIIIISFLPSKTHQNNKPLFKEEGQGCDLKCKIMLVEDQDQKRETTLEQKRESNQLELSRGSLQDLFISNWFHMTFFVKMLFKVKFHVLDQTRDLSHQRDPKTVTFFMKRDHRKGFLVGPLALSSPKRMHQMAMTSLIAVDFLLDLSFAT